MEGGGQRNKVRDKRGVEKQRKDRISGGHEDEGEIGETQRQREK